MGTSTYAYDGEGRRVAKTTPTGTTYYVYDAMGQLAAEYATGSIAASPCTTCYVAADHLGSTRALWDTSGLKARYDYHPFGEAIAADRNGRTGMQCTAGVATCYNGPSSVAQRFTGQLRDEETGLDYFNARYYAQGQGRFMSPDPLPGKVADPASWNMYGYARNNPQLYTDPTGKSYAICNSSGICGLYSDDDYDRLRKDSNYIVINGQIYQRNKDGTQGTLLGGASKFDTDLDNLGQTVVGQLDEASERTNKFIVAVATASVLAGAVAGVSPVAGQAINELAFGPGTGRFFWAGGPAAKGAAEAYGYLSGSGRTISQSPLGAFWERFASRLPSSVEYKGWEILSKYWSSGAEGIVNVFARSPKDKSILMRIELPTLLNNPNVFKPLQYK